MSQNHRIGHWIILIFLLAGAGGCKKLLEVSSPSTSLSSENVYGTDGNAIAVLTGIYTNMSNSNVLYGGGYNLDALSLYPALSADELSLFTGANNTICTAYYTNTLNYSNTGNIDFWVDIYPVIYVTNAAIAGLANNSALTPAVDRQLLGEALFVRAFCYFYLVNLYGDVPLVLTPDYKVNQTMTRTNAGLVWQQITQDLSLAQGLLSQNYLDGTLLNTTSERVRPTYWSASALLARTYLYRQKWDSAEEEASLVINNNNLYGLTGLDTAFLANSNEAIWQWVPVGLGKNTPDAQVFIIPPTGPGGNWPVSLSNGLLSVFEPGDERRVHWVDSVISQGVTYYFPFKYKVDSIGAPVTEYEMVLRIGEQRLIRAEARAEQGNISGAAGALSDLDAIRSRAGLPGYGGPTDQVSILTAIQRERRVELFTEWGNRWFDLKRTNSIDKVMGTPGNASAAKGTSWSSYMQWYPITETELRSDPNLQQNPGY